MIVHNLKIALRNLMNYKVQTIISVLSIAIGIVTFSIAHSAMTRFDLPMISHEPYYERAYAIMFDSLGKDNPQVDSETYADKFPIRINTDLIRALKSDGGLTCVEEIAIPNGLTAGGLIEFHLCDSTVLKGQMEITPIDPQYPNYAGLRSAITGKKIKVLKPGEAIMSEAEAKRFFGNVNPIGAIQVLTSDWQPTPVTIVDVYRNISNFEKPLRNSMVYYAAKDLESQDVYHWYYAVWVNVVLKENCTEKQLLTEVNERIRHLGLKANVSREADDHNNSRSTVSDIIVHLIGSLILIAAIIGFLRLQIQLFWSRRREISLRIANGAKRIQLFNMLITEAFITICLSVIAAIPMGCWVEDFINTRFEELTREVSIQNLYLYSMETGVLLLILCCTIVWFTLSRICKAEQGIVANMRQSRTHLFRNTMLSVQITISMIFVCGTLILFNWSEKMLSNFHLPENESFYKECILLRSSYTDQPERLINEIKHLDDLDRIITYSNFWPTINEIQERPEVLPTSDNNLKEFYCTTDTALFSFYGIEVHWFNQHTNHNQYLLINEDLYKKLYEVGLLTNGTLTITDTEKHTLPIAGTIKGIPYYSTRPASIIINPDRKDFNEEYVLIPKENKYKSLMRNVDETIQRLEPSIINKMTFNFREQKAVEASIIESMRTGGWILGAVSIIICAMSIFSTIALDTRARKKEVAIRKVNGAKGKDIYRMFGRIYFILILLSLFVAIPVSILFNQMMQEIISGVMPDRILSPVMPILIGTLTIAVSIFIIVNWNIRKIIRINPAEIIAKE